MSLRNITFPDDLEYSSDGEHLPLEFYLEAFPRSKVIYLKLGYFSSLAIQVLAYGFAQFIHNGGSIKIVTNHFLSTEDKSLLEIDDLRLDEKDESDLVTNLGWLNSQLTTEQSHVVNCLKMLIRLGRVEFIPTMLKPNRMLHYKEGVFMDDAGDMIKLLGSCNFTARGLVENAESLEITLSWLSEADARRVSKKKEQIELILKGEDERYEHLDIDKIEDAIQEIGKDKTMEELLEDELNVLGNESTEYLKVVLKKYRNALEEEIKNLFDSEPSQIDLKLSLPIELGGQPFKIKAHQIATVKAWKEANYKGIFALATGAGKTVTSLFAATQVYKAKKKRKEKFALVISVPYIALAEQWCESLKDFSSIPPIKCWDSVKIWLSDLKRYVDAFNHGQLDFFIVVVVNRTMEKTAFQNLFASISEEHIMFIGDECHNHGSVKTNKSLIEAYFRVGLSATPFRSDDEEFDSPFPNIAKERILNFYSEIVYEYSLQDAINDGVLCRYDYHIIPTYLTDEEFEKYHSLSAEISKLIQQAKGQGRTRSSDSSQLTIKCGQRSRLLGAAENKFHELDRVISKIPDNKKRHSLFYCGEGLLQNFDSQENENKNRENERLIENASKILGERHWRSSRYTSAENKQERERIMDDFKNGDIDALVSVRVLDEGVDIPACDKAFIMASTKNPRQYIQRRGRVLRKAKGKEKASIYDFVVLPPPGITDRYARRLIESEKERIDDYCILAENKYDIYQDLRRLGIEND